jgi:porin
MKTKARIAFCLVLFITLAILQVYADEPYSSSISSNPGAVNIELGTGALGEALGIKHDSGIKLGGIWIGDINYLIAGGAKPHKWGGNNLFQLGVYLDTEKLHWWNGGLFGTEFLQFNGRPVNVQAGCVQGYNSLSGPPPRDRTEFYQFWFRQEFFKKKLIFRIGKLAPALDFNNVVKPLPIAEESLSIPATTGLIYATLFINGTLLGILPGYYDTICGVTATYAPMETFYISYGLYDGNMARQKRTGLRGPQFNGYRFQIAEMGCSWNFGKSQLPGNIGIGAWDQTGKLTTSKTKERGIQGVYIFGTQRLWRRNPGIDNSGIIGFLQLGINNSNTLPINQYFGTGVTFLGLVPGRIKDSFGVGLALSKLNRHTFARKSELLLQGYYEMFLVKDVFFLTAISYFPKPGAAKDLPSAWAATARVISLF